MQKVSNVPQKLSRAWLLRNRNTTELFTFWFSADFSSSSFQNFVKLGHIVYFFMLHPNMITGSNYWLVLENRKCNFRKSKNRLRHFFLIFCTDFAPVVRFSLAITVFPGTRNGSSRPLCVRALRRCNLNNLSMAPNNAMFVDSGAKRPIVRKNKNQTNFRSKYQKIITVQKCKLFSHFLCQFFIANITH